MKDCCSDLQCSRTYSGAVAGATSALFTREYGNIMKYANMMVCRETAYVGMITKGTSRDKYVDRQQKQERKNP